MKSFYDNPETRAQLKPEVIWEIEQSQILTDSDRSNANLIRASWYSELERMFSQYDFLVLPTAQVFPYPKTTTWPREINGRSMDTYHRWMEVVILGSLGGLPVINVPVGFDAQGRPMGMQIWVTMARTSESWNSLWPMSRSLTICNNGQNWLRQRDVNQVN